MSVLENRIKLTFGTEGINYLSTSPEGFPMERQGNNVPDEYKLSGDVVCIPTVLPSMIRLDTKYAAIAYTGYEELVAEALEMANILIPTSRSASL